MEKPENIHSNILHAIQLLSIDRKNNMEKAISIIEDSISKYDTNRYPDYSTGLAGIGYGIQYLIYTGLINAKADEVLSEFDQHLFSIVYFQQHTDFSHATGLMGIASYFFARLENPDANEDNLPIAISKTVLLSILDILLARFKVNGYYSYEKQNQSISNPQELSDIERFIHKFISCNICNGMALKLLNKIKQDKILPIEVYNEPIESNMYDTTIVIPIHADSEIRIQNLHTIIHLYSNLKNVHFIIMEIDQIQRIHLEENKQIKYLFQKDEDLIFHHTHYRNELIKLAKTPIVIVWDVDILVPVAQLYKAVNDVRKHRAILSYPYDGICYNLPPNISNHFRNTLEWELLVTGENKFQKMFGELTVGGIFVINREKYIQAGMENEYFVGWGPEDIERLKRLTLLGLPISRIDGCIYHLYHPRKLNSCYINQSQNLKMKKELLRICRMSKKDLLHEIATWKWIIQ